MRVKAVLWRQPRKDETCAVKIYFNPGEGGKVKYFLTGVAVLPKDWDDQKARVRKSHPLSVQYNSKINAKRLSIEQELLNTGSVSKKKLVNLLKVYDRYLHEQAQTGSVSKSTLTVYRATRNQLERFAEQHSVSVAKHTTERFREQFSHYLSSRGGCKQHTVALHFQRIRRVVKLMLPEGTIRMGDLRVAQPKQRPNTIYLTREEVRKLEELEVPNFYRRRARDFFLLCYYLILRYSDAKRISRDRVVDIEGEPFFYGRDKKTKGGKVVPVSENALKIMEAYNYDFSQVPEPYLVGKHLRKVCRKAGITEIIDRDGELIEKCDLVTTHTARRSAATHLYLAGASFKMIADLGGWKSVDAMQRYFRSGGLDSAKIAAKQFDQFK